MPYSQSHGAWVAIESGTSLMPFITSLDGAGDEEHDGQGGHIGDLGH